LFDLFAPWVLAYVALCFVVAGFVKGLVGFGLPLVAVSLTGQVLTIEQAVVLNLFPVILSNLLQAFSGGHALPALKRFKWLIVALLIGLAVGTRLLVSIDSERLMLLLGLIVIGYCALDMIGLRLYIRHHQETPAGVLAGLVAGIMGGLSTVYGPPLVMYLLGVRLPRAEFIATVGLLWLLAGLFLALSYWAVSLLTGPLALLSLALAVPTILCFLLGDRLGRRCDQLLFRRLLLFTLMVIGLNLIRRGLS
jgi:uncharacterized protein